MILKSGRKSQVLNALCLTTILAGFAAPFTAHAQETIAPQSAATGDTTTAQPEAGLGEIIVTATRQSESIQKVTMCRTQSG